MQQARSQRGGDAGDDAPPKSGKRSTFGHKGDQKWGFCRRVGGGGEVQIVHFLGPKGPLLGGSAPSQIRSWLRACNAESVKRPWWCSLIIGNEVDHKVRLYEPCLEAPPASYCAELHHYCERDRHCGVISQSFLLFIWNCHYSKAVWF